MFPPHKRPASGPSFSRETRAVEAADGGLPARKQAARDNLCRRGQATLRSSYQELTNPRRGILLQPLEHVGPTHYEDKTKVAVFRGSISQEGRGDRMKSVMGFADAPSLIRGQVEALQGWCCPARSIDN